MARGQDADNENGAESVNGSLDLAGRRGASIYGHGRLEWGAPNRLEYRVGVLKHKGVPAPKPIHKVVFGNSYATGVTQTRNGGNVPQHSPLTSLQASEARQVEAENITARVKPSAPNAAWLSVQKPSTLAAGHNPMGGSLVPMPALAQSVAPEAEPEPVQAPLNVTPSHPVPIETVGPEAVETNVDAEDGEVLSSAADATPPVPPAGFLAVGGLVRPRRSEPFVAPITSFEDEQKIALEAELDSAGGRKVDTSVRDDFRAVGNDIGLRATNRSVHGSILNDPLNIPLSSVLDAGSVDGVEEEIGPEAVFLGVDRSTGIARHETERGLDPEPKSRRGFGPRAALLLALLLAMTGVVMLTSGGLILGGKWPVRADAAMASQALERSGQSVGKLWQTGTDKVAFFAQDLRTKLGNMSRPAPTLPAVVFDRPASPPETVLSASEGSEVGATANRSVGDDPAPVVRMELAGSSKPSEPVAYDAALDNAERAAPTPYDTSVPYD